MNKRTLLFAIISICTILFLLISTLCNNRKIEIAIYSNAYEDVLYFKVDFLNNLTIQHGTESNNLLLDGDIMQNVKYEERITLEKAELEMINKAILAMNTSHTDNRFAYRDCSTIQVLYQKDFYVYSLAEGACPEEVITLAQYLSHLVTGKTGT